MAGGVPGQGVVDKVTNLFGDATENHQDQGLHTSLLPQFALDAAIRNNPELAGDLQELQGYIENSDDGYKGFIQYVAENPDFLRSKAGESVIQIINQASATEQALRSGQIKGGEDWLMRMMARDDELQRMKMGPMNMLSTMQGLKGALGSIMEVLADTGIIDQKYGVMAKKWIEESKQWGDEVARVNEEHDLGTDDRTAFQATAEMDGLSGKFNSQGLTQDTLNGLGMTLSTSDQQLVQSYDDLGNMLGGVDRLQQQLQGVSPEQYQQSLDVVKLQDPSAEITVPTVADPDATRSEYGFGMS